MYSHSEKRWHRSYI